MLPGGDSVQTVDLHGVLVVAHASWVLDLSVVRIQILHSTNLRTAGQDPITQNIIDPSPVSWFVVLVSIRKLVRYSIVIV